MCTAAEGEWDCATGRDLEFICKIHILSLTLHIYSGIITVLIVQQPECSTLCEVLQSLLGTARFVQEKRIGIPNLNLIILFQQVPGDWPPPCFPEGAAICFPLHWPSPG